MKLICLAAPLSGLFLSCLIAGNAVAAFVTTDLPDYTVKTPTVAGPTEEPTTDLGAEAALEFCFETLPTFNESLDDPSNAVFMIELDELIETPLFITDISWDMNLETIGASWASEATFEISTDLSPSVFLAPAAGVDSPIPPTNFSGSAALGGTLPFLFSSDGVITIELFEAFNDAPGPDANLLANSTLTFGLTDAFGEPHTATVKWVPEPGIFGLALSGLLCLAGFVRRR